MFYQFKWDKEINKYNILITNIFKYKTQLINSLKSFYKLLFFLFQKLKNKTFIY